MCGHEALGAWNDFRVFRNRRNDDRVFPEVQAGGSPAVTPARAPRCVIHVDVNECQMNGAWRHGEKLITVCRWRWQGAEGRRGAPGSLDYMGVPGRQAPRTSRLPVTVELCHMVVFGSLAALRGPRATVEKQLHAQAEEWA